MAKKPKFSKAAKQSAKVRASEHHNKEWLRRSKAAKKGWQTRKKRTLPKKIARAKKLIANGRVVLGKKPLNPRIQKRRTVKQLEEILEKAEETIKKQGETIHEHELNIARHMMLSGWVHAAENNMLREDYTVALEPSRLRHLPITDKLKRRLDKASGGNFGVAAMDLAKADRRRLYLVASQMSEMYNVSIREVYTLFYSP